MVLLDEDKRALYDGIYDGIALMWEAYYNGIPARSENPYSMDAILTRR